MGYMIIDLVSVFILDFMQQSPNIERGERIMNHAANLAEGAQCQGSRNPFERQSKSANKPFPYHRSLLFPKFSARRDHNGWMMS